MLLFSLFFGGFLVLMIYASYRDNLDAKMFAAEQNRQNQDFLETNEGKTALVLFQEISGKTHVCVCGPFTAGIERWHLSRDIRITAIEKANEYLDKSMERGFFENSNRERFPLCNVTKAWVEEVADETKTDTR